MRYFPKPITFIGLMLSCVLIGCGSKLPAVQSFKMDIQQGNVVTSKMLLQLRPGMTKSQVRYIMGTPLITDSFHGNRWDYFYQLRQQGKVVEKRRVILDFEKDLLVSVRGDVVPATEQTAEAPVDTSARSVTPAQKPAEKSWFDMFKFWGSDEPVAQVEPKAMQKPLSEVPSALAAGKENSTPQVAETAEKMGEVAAASASAIATATGELSDAESILKVKPQVGNTDNLNLLPAAPAAVAAGIAQASSAESNIKSESTQPSDTDNAVADNPVVETTMDSATAVASSQAGIQDATTAKQAIQIAVDGWAQAWRNKRLADYLSAYAKNFKPENGSSKSAWVAQRKQRLSGKRGDISLVLEDVEINTNGNQATVQFFQKYASKVFSDEVTKQLDLSFDDATQRWLIVREFVVVNGRRAPSQKVLAPEETSEHLDGVIEKIGF